MFACAPGLMEPLQVADTPYVVSKHWGLCCVDDALGLPRGLTLQCQPFRNTWEEQ